MNVPLILWLGTMGAVIGTILSESVVTIYQVYAIKNQLDLRGLFSESWKHCLSAVVMFGVVKGLEIAWSTSLIGLVVEVLIGMVVYFVVLLGLRPHIIIGYVRPYVDQMRRRLR